MRLSALCFLFLFLFISCNTKEKPIKHIDNSIISLLPSLTETVCALGLSQHLIGVSLFCVYPKQVVDSLPKVGDCINPNVEQILTMKPSLVLLGDMQTEAEDKLRGLKIPVIKFNQSRISDVYDAFHVLGKMYNVERRADSIVAGLKTSLDSIHSVNSGRPLKRVLFVVGRTPGSLSNIYSINCRSFLAELLHAAGGASVFDSMPLVWCKVSLEEIIIRNPEYIIETALMGNSSEASEIWKGLPGIEAVKKGHVYTLQEEYVFTPGPRMVKTAAKLSQLLGQ